MTSTATFLSTPSKLIIADTPSGIQLQSTRLNTMWNVYFTAWQDASPIADYTPFGARFDNQAFSLDPGANSFGFAASNAATGKIGF